MVVGLVRLLFGRRTLLVVVAPEAVAQGSLQLLHELPPQVIVIGQSQLQRFVQPRPVLGGEGGLDVAVRRGPIEKGVDVAAQVGPGCSLRNWRMVSRWLPSLR